MWGVVFYHSKTFAIILSAAFALVGCSNIFSNFTNHTDRGYLIDSARNALGSAHFDEALTAINPVYLASPQDEEVVMIVSSAYAGRAGLRALDLFEQIQSKLGAGRRLFEVFAEHFEEGDADTIADMDLAAQAIEGVSNLASGRSSMLNFFSVFVYYGRIGAALRATAYDSNLSLVAGYDACSTTYLEEENVDRLVVSMARVKDSLNSIPNGDALGGAFIPSGFPMDDPECPSDLINCALMRTLVNDNTTIGLGVGSVCP